MPETRLQDSLPTHFSFNHPFKALSTSTEVRLVLLREYPNLPYMSMLPSSISERFVQLWLYNVFVYS